MSQPFNSQSGLILVEAEVSGPTGTVNAALVLDTGATTTTINRSLLRSIGYDPDGDRSRPDDNGNHRRNGSSVDGQSTEHLGRHAIGLRVLAHDLPAEAAVDGLLGLDFFRNLTLHIDFRQGQLILT